MTRVDAGSLKGEPSTYSAETSKYHAFRAVASLSKKKESYFNFEVKNAEGLFLFYVYHL